MSEKQAGWAFGRLGRQLSATLILALLVGCGAQELYEPPRSDYAIVGQLALPCEIEGVSVLGDLACIAGGEGGLFVVDISNPSAPVLLRDEDTPKYAEAIQAVSFEQGGSVIDVAYVIDGTEGVTMFDVTDPTRVDSLTFGVEMTAIDAQGIYVDVPDGPNDRIFAYVAESWRGIRVLEILPADPGVPLDRFVAKNRGKAYDVSVEDGFAYVADNEMGITVIDMRLAGAGNAIELVKRVSHLDTPGTARGIDVQGGYIYVADGDNGLVIKRIVERVFETGGNVVPVPAHFTGTGEIDDPELGHLLLDGRCEDIVVRDNLAFLAAHDGGVHTVDVSDPRAPRLVGTVVTSDATGLDLTKSGIAVSDAVDGLLLLASHRAFNDVVPPATVTDLAASTWNHSTVLLEWSAPGNDSYVGRAAEYDVRYATTTISTEDDWDAATPRTDEPIPGRRLSRERFLVRGLDRGTEYFFALRTADHALNWSSRSNVTSAPPDSVPPFFEIVDSVDPDVGPAAEAPDDTTFVFEVTYFDRDGDAPIWIQVVISAESSPVLIRADMVLVGENGEPDYEFGALYQRAVALGQDSYTHYFVSSDGIHGPVSSDVFIGPDAGLVGVVMGSPTDEPGRSQNETQHRARFNRLIDPRDSFSTHEVTQREYEALMFDNPSHHVGSDFPVERVTWYEAIEYCNELSDREAVTRAYTINGRNVTWDRNADGYRLPTEAEWEMICRAYSPDAFAGGPLTEEACGFEPSLENLGWYCGNSAVAGVRATHAVMHKTAPDLVHFYDMHGNVREWCWDRYQEDLGSEVVWDPSGPATGESRVIRGGSFDDYARRCRSAWRLGFYPDNRDSEVGFRVVRTIQWIE